MSYFALACSAFVGWGPESRIPVASWLVARASDLLVYSVLPSHSRISLLRLFRQQVWFDSAENSDESNYGKSCQQNPDVERAFETLRRSLLN